MSAELNGASPDTQAVRLFADGIPGLRERSPLFWETAGTGDISYPAGGHASFAAVEQTSYWFNHRNAVIASTVKRHPPRGAIVDVGGGNGYVSLGLRKAGFDTLVVEPGSVGAHCAYDRGLPVIMAPFERLDVPAGSIPAAGLFDVLEHIEDDAGALRSLHAAMQPGGMLYLAVPAFGWLWSAEDVHAGHFRRYTQGRLAKLVAAQGFTVEYATYFFSMLVPPVLALRSIPSRLGIKTKEPSAAADDHRLPGGAVGSALSRAMAWEARRIAAGGTVPLGSSCLLVARRAG